MLRILLLAAVADTALALDPPAPPKAPTAPAVPIVASAAIVPNTDLSLLPLTLPGYELRVLDQRKTLAYEAGGAHFEVHLPIFFYLPNAEESQSLHALRQAVDELRRAAHQPDRNEYDFEKLLTRFEQDLSALGEHLDR